MLKELSRFLVSSCKSDSQRILWNAILQIGVCKNMINRRRHKRIIISGGATLEFKKEGEIQSIQTLITNMSFRGIGLYSDSSIIIGTSVSITINFISLSGGVKTDSIKGRVITIRKIGDTHILGIRFNEEITAQNQPSLFKHLQNTISFQQIISR